jgi:proteasome lid subunit RPN8/RPN11
MTINRLKISKQALSSITAHVTRGFETPYKKEVGGHLLGYQEKTGLYVSRAIPYNTPYSTRTAWGTIQYYFRKKGLRLETKRLKWIGTYHSHVQINRSASTGQSKEDMEAHLFSDRPVDLIVRITNYRMRSPKICLSYKTIMDSHVYYYDICGYVKNLRDKINMMTVESAAHVKIMF